MELFITIKEASELVGKVEMTIRRAVKKAPSNMTATDEKGRLLVDKSYIASLYNVTENVTDVTPNVPIHSGTNTDVTVLALTKELDNKQDTLNNLSNRLQEANTIINTLSNKLTETTKMLLESKEPINADHDKVVILEETIRQLEDELNAPIEPVNPIRKKSFPLLEVISIGVSIVFAGSIVFYVMAIH
jgi:septal ring factor EnvC (AmiA/AmiB activator)